MFDGGERSIPFIKLHVGGWEEKISQFPIFAFECGSMNLMVIVGILFGIEHSRYRISHPLVRFSRYVG
jgi:hypothetical protein